MAGQRKVSTEALEWAEEQVRAGVLNSPPSLNPDGSPRTLRQLLDESKKKMEVERAIELVTTMMREFPEIYAARGKAFRVEFFTNDSNGEMLAFMHTEKPELCSSP